MIRTCAFGMIGPKEAEAVGCTKDGCMAWVDTCAKCDCKAYFTKPQNCPKECPFNEPHCVRLE